MNQESFQEAHDYIKEKGVVDDCKLTKEGWHEEVTELVEKGLVRVDEHEYNNRYVWVPDDESERADAQYVDGAGNPVSPDEYVDDSLEDNAICMGCGETHENGACWDENDDGGDTYILEDAIETVYERPEQHGEPEDSFLTIANFWSTYLGTVQEEGRQIVTPSDVAMMMALLKIARSAEGHYDEDNPTDLAGYAENYARLKEET